MKERVINTEGGRERERGERASEREREMQALRELCEPICQLHHRSLSAVRREKPSERRQEERGCQVVIKGETEGRGR